MCPIQYGLTSRQNCSRQKGKGDKPGFKLGCSEGRPNALTNWTSGALALEHFLYWKSEGRKRGREGGREGGREEGREEGRKGGREGVREGGGLFETWSPATTTHMQIWISCKLRSVVCSLIVGWSCKQEICTWLCDDITVNIGISVTLCLWATPKKIKQRMLSPQCLW